ncbi:MAG: DUF1501 domain-containing protein [Acidobacteria bacterium]|nr:DUF1501 domain-containing protein [Acidobacteriota bacterium]
MHKEIDLTRRKFLQESALGLTGVALTSLLRGEAGAAPHILHHPPRAKQVLQIFCPGAASHLDLWDYKPALEKYDGTPLPGAEKEVTFQGKNGNLMKSPWPFVAAGSTGKRISSLLPRLTVHVDDIAFIHSMTSRSNTHGPASVFMNTGSVREGFPSAGAWVGYALGSLNDNLPTFVAITDVRGEPPNGKANWASGFLPAQHQAVMLAAHQPLRNLNRPADVSPQEDIATREFLRQLNEDNANLHPAESDLAARTKSYEMAARMQLAAPEVADLTRESAATHQLYGTDDRNPLKAAYARNCLLSRRLLEKGVRYVSLYCASRASGVDGLLNWDAHRTLKTDYERHCPIFDQPTAALLTDLKQRGMLKDTLVLWVTEFGRMPTHQEGTTGRDHNPDGFTLWLMGAGIRPGTYGATDDLGRRAVEKVATVYDFYATVLHLLGLDHERLTWYHNGMNRRLTDVHGHVIHEIIA